MRYDKLFETVLKQIHKRRPQPGMPTKLDHPIEVRVVRLAACYIDGFTLTSHYDTGAGLYGRLQHTNGDHSCVGCSVMAWQHFTCLMAGG